MGAAVLRMIPVLTCKHLRMCLSARCVAGVQQNPLSSANTTATVLVSCSARVRERRRRRAKRWLPQLHMQV
eukprot:11563871-Alexandrium_andersonii.AAC.1